MNISAIVMMVFGCFVVWGGLLMSIGITLKKENKRD
ncbi:MULTISPECIES: methionine/alanine import family NSS transporter small subunit [unclassified Fusobacterium]|nr:methionine/alanine import family NSS transporter small subunit [Fusobacterium sp.]